MEKSVARRTEELRVKLAPSLAAEFSAIAQGRGVLPATLAALALGNTSRSTAAINSSSSLSRSTAQAYACRSRIGSV